MNFNESDKVVCVDDTPVPTHSDSPLWSYSFPGGMIVKGETYCVSGLAATRNRGIGLIIVGKPCLQNVADLGTVEVGWSPRRFRLLKTLSALEQHSRGASQANLSDTAPETLSPYLLTMGCVTAVSRNMPLGRESAQKRHGYCAVGGFIFAHRNNTRGQEDRNLPARGEYRAERRTAIVAAVRTGLGDSQCDVSPTIRGAILGEWRNVKTRAWTSKIGNDAAMRERGKPWSFHVSTFANNPPPNQASLK